MIYFDCYAALGRKAGKDPLAPWTTEQMLADMQRCRIHGALVYAHQARETHPEVGNPIISEICRENERLYPCWVTLPHQMGEVLPPKQFLLEMEKQDVRALKIFPREFWHPVEETTLGELLGLLQETQTLLIVDRGEYGDYVQIDWEEIDWICKSYPRLPLLLHSVRWEATRRLAPLLERRQNIHLEFSNYQGNRMLEFWTERIGVERLLFGTEAMEKCHGAARAYVDYADLTEAQKRAVAGENLMRLLKIETPPPAYPESDSDDLILKKALAGQPIDDMTVVDGHAHIVQKGGRGASRVAMNQADAEGVVKRNRALGVNKTCVSAWTAIWGDYKLGNEDTIEAMKDFPGEILGYAALDPNYVTDWASECEYYYEKHGFVGMKPYHPRMQRPYNDPLYEPWWAYGNDHHLIALMHPSDNFFAEMVDLATRFPNVQFLLAHSGWTWKIARDHVELGKRFPNCFLEITFTAVLNGVIEYLVREVGSQRVVYGSDAPMRDPFPQFGWVAYADISEEEKRDVFGRNMEKILATVERHAKKKGS